MRHYTSDTCPKITVIDNHENTSVLLNEHYSRRVEIKRKTDEFSVGDHSFSISHILQHSSAADGHSVIFCANSFPVLSETLKKSVTFQDGPLLYRAKHPFYYCAMVEGDLLDSSVDANRTQFNLFRDRAQSPLLTEVTLADIRKQAVRSSRRFLSRYTRSLRQQHWERIERICKKDARYRILLTQAEDRLKRIDPSIDTDQGIELEIYRIYRDVKVELRKRTSELSKKAAQHISDYEAFRRELSEVLGNWNQQSMAELAQYIVDRKAILAFLEERLNRRDDQSFPLEEAIHRIFFPMGHTSDTYPAEDANLWIIDERLAFHRFMGSDRPIRTHEPIDSQSDKEPDLAVYQEAAFAASRSFAESNLQPGAVTLVEFKRPGRDDYTRSDNPFTQAVNYITDIRSGKSQRVGGRPFQLRENTPFFVYIICDLKPTLRALADEEYTPTPDGLGYFRYQPHYKAWIEVISYDKLVDDAKKRNKVLFDKLELTDEL